MDDRKLAQKELINRGAACVAVRGGIVEFSLDKGVKPLLSWLKQEICPLSGACVADKVVGKAAALLFAYGGVSHVYALVISEHAAKALRDNGIPFSYGEKVPYIINRAKTGMCPMEQKVLETSSPLKAYQILTETTANQNK